MGPTKGWIALNVVCLMGLSPALFLGPVPLVLGVIGIVFSGSALALNLRRLEGEARGKPPHPYRGPWEACIGDGD
jgi:hypothetical protein